MSDNMKTKKCNLITCINHYLYSEDISLIIETFAECTQFLKIIIMQVKLLPKGLPEITDNFHLYNHYFLHCLLRILLPLFLTKYS